MFKRAVTNKVKENLKVSSARGDLEDASMNGQNRSDIYPGLEVDIILKQDQRSGKLTRGIVKNLLTSSAYHSRGIKVRLEDGQVGRVAWIVEED